MILFQVAGNRRFPHLRLQGRLPVIAVRTQGRGVPYAVAQPLAGRADRPQEWKIRRPDLYVKEFYGSGVF
jgi:hypothetical protein